MDNSSEYMSYSLDHHPKEYYGRVIEEAKLVEPFTTDKDSDLQELHLKFQDGTKIAIFDSGQD